VILDYYRERHLRRLIGAARKSTLVNDTPIYYGTYWGVGVNTRPPLPGPEPPPTKRIMPNRRYAPIFSLARTDFWERRELTPAEEQTLRNAGDPGLAGRVPDLASLLYRSGRYRYLAGLEVGRRMRDRIRIKRAGHLRVVTWQWDEITSEIAAGDGYKHRQVLQGILRGLAYGRPALGDTWLPGLVWITGRGLTVANRPARGDLPSFWQTVDETSLFLIGEEYVDFTGSPGRAAARQAAWRDWLFRWGGHRRSLATKYVAGLTPGYASAPGYGGNVKRRSRSAVRNWRLSFIRARATHALAGLAEYNFNDRNASGAVINDVVQALARGVRVLRTG
jgi:hypothetical protein